MTNLEKSSFIEPSPKPELDGELGLYASEIAASLGTLGKKVRQKLRSDGFLERVEKQGFQGVLFSTPNKVNGIEYEEVVLDVDAAKFFVGKWNNELGDAYLGFLIRLENKVNEFEKLVQSDPIISTLTMSMKLRQKQLEQDEKIKQIQLNTSDEVIDVKVRAALSKEDEFPSDCMTISEIAATHFPGISKEIVRGVLSKSNHPKGHFQHKNEKGETNMSRPYKKAGLEFVAKRFFDEAKIVEETPKTIIRVHPRVGGRIFQSKAKMRAG